jgi:hypothetical protein
MQFQTRSKTRAVADLAAKLLQLPPRHPHRYALARMVEGLKVELREHGRGASPRTRTEDDPLAAADWSLPLGERRRFPVVERFWERGLYFAVAFARWTATSWGSPRVAPHCNLTILHPAQRNFSSNHDSNCPERAKSFGDAVTYWACAMSSRVR